MYFEKTWTLLDFLTNCPVSASQPSNVCLKSKFYSENDDPKYIYFLKTTIVGINDTSKFEFPNLSLDVHYKQKEIVDKVIGILVKNAKYNINNTLTLGYRMQNERVDNYVHNMLGVENVAPSSIVNLVKSKLWELLLSRIGQAAMIFLLTKVYLFIAVENGCFLQVTGTALYELKDGEAKEASVGNMETDSYVQKFNYAKSVDRIQMLYQKPRKQKNGNILFGFRDDHILNKPPAEILSFVFSSSVEKKKKLRAKWRFKKSLKLINDIVSLKKKCHFRAILDFHCPKLYTHVEEQSEMLKFQTPYYQVWMFLKSVLDHLVPKEFWGSKENKMLGHFYVTESSSHKHRLFYFRNDVWELLLQPTVEKLTRFNLKLIGKKNNFTNVPEVEPSNIRFLPKEKGFRPIINLGRKVVDNRENYRKSKKSVNKLLENTFQILSYEKNNNEFLMGASCLGLTDIYKKFQEFKAKRNSLQKFDEKFYFVKIDVKQAFDSINQNLLLKIVYDIIKEEEYVIQRYAMLYKNGERVHRNFMKKALPTIEQKPFSIMAKQLAQKLKNAILIDQIFYKYEKSGNIKEILSSHIERNLVKIGQKLYHQCTGIPQGSILSSLLCSLYYGNMESAEKISLSFNKEKDLFIRLVDDFLLITADLEKAKAFLTHLSKGIDRYGCIINSEKSLVNFDIKINNKFVPRIHDNEFFPWCGLLIGTKNLNICNDYFKVNKLHLSDSLTLGLALNQGTSFKNKIFQ
ncbi:hypothetical protein HDU92_006396 [Lobulomyces angularis]|nr:hypothetical protein HDU92_006396 [Lobulomyces angularis]